MCFPTSIIIPIGGPGAGKGTVSRALREVGYEHISTGDHFRSHVKRRTTFGIDIQATVERGDLLPDSVVIQALADLLDEHCGGLVLDGFPRSLGQCQWLSQRMEERGTPFLPIHLQAPTKLLLQRALSRRVCPRCKRSYGTTQQHVAGNCNDCGDELVQRLDDREEVVGRRLSVMESWLPAVLKFYAPRGLKGVPVAGTTSAELAETVLSLAASSISKMTVTLSAPAAERRLAKVY